MMTKKEIQKAEKEKKPIYCLCRSDKKIYKADLTQRYWVDHTIDNNRKQYLEFYNSKVGGYPLKYVFKTRDEAEHYRDYVDIPSNTKLNLPYYSDIKNASKDLDGMYNPYLVLEKFFSGKTMFEFYLDYENELTIHDDKGYPLFTKPLNKSNYLEAKAIVKKLFLGEEV